MFSLGILVNLRFFFIISPLQNLNILKNSSKQPLDTSKYFITNAKNPSNWVKTNLIEGYNSLKLLRILKKHPCKFLDIHSLLFKLSFSFSKLYRCFWGNWGLWHNLWRKENWTIEKRIESMNDISVNTIENVSDAQNLKRLDLNRPGRLVKLNVIFVSL